MHAFSIDLLTSDEVMAKSVIRRVYKRKLLQAVCAVLILDPAAAKQLFQLGGFRS